MNKKMLAPAVIALSSVFVACGLIPAQKVDNPLQLSGKQVSVPLSNATFAKTGLAPMAAGSGGSLNLNATFDDQSSLASLPLNPASFSVTLEFSSASIAAGCPATLPNTMNAQFSTMKVVVSDATNGSSTVTFPNTTIPLTKSGTSYTVGTPTPALTAQFSDVGKLITILKLSGANTPNTAAVTGSVVTDQPSLAGCTLNLTFGAGSGTINF